MTRSTQIVTRSAALVALLVATTVADARTSGSKALNIAGTPPLTRVEMAPLEGRGRKRNGSAVLLLDDGTAVSLAAKEKVGRKGAKYVLKSKQPKVKMKFKTVGEPERVVAVKLIYRGADGEKVRLTDAARVSMVSVAAAGSINATVEALPDWPIQETEPEEPVDLGADLVDEGDTQFVCRYREVDLKKNFDDIIAVGANNGVLWPGALVQGTSVQSGLLSSIPLPRSPIAISTSLPIENPVRVIEHPDSASVQAAIAGLMREADTRLGSLDVIPAQIQFSKTEVHSFEQSLLEIGISAKYGSVFSSIEGSIDASISQSVNSHTILVRFMQPMFTISFADERLPTPADFLASDATAEDVAAQEEAGTIGSQNLPTYVKSVTYGRMMIFTMTSSEAESARELEAALEASYGLFSGSAQVTSRQRQLLSSSRVTMLAFGGRQEDALNAIAPPCDDSVPVPLGAPGTFIYRPDPERAGCTGNRNGNWQAFLKAAPATTAVPLSYRINYLKDRTPAVLGDATKFVEELCTPVTAVRFTVTLEDIEIIQADDRFAYRIFASAHAGNDQIIPVDCRQAGAVIPVGIMSILEEETSSEPSVAIETTLSKPTICTYAVGNDCWKSQPNSRRFRKVTFPLDTNPYGFNQQLQLDNCIAQINWTVEIEPLL